MATFLTTEQRDKILELYVAYFNRAPESAGLHYWSDYFLGQLNAGVSEADILDDMSDQFYEAGCYYSALTGYTAAMTVQEFITVAYANVLGRTSTPGTSDGVDAEGMAYWTAKLESGEVSRGQFIQTLIAAAKQYVIDNPGSPYAWVSDYLDNRLEVAAWFSQTGVSGGLEGEEAIARGMEVLENVTADHATVDAIINAGITGETYNLTTAQDEILITGLQINTVKGIVDGTTPANSTFTVGDSVDGNGKTILQLAVANTGNAAFATLRDIADVNVIAGDTGTINFNAGDWANIGAVNLAGGLDGLNVYVQSLEDGADLTIGEDVAGTISADYQNGMYAQLWNTGDGGASFIDGAVTFAAETGASAGAYFSAGDGDAVTVGDVVGTGANSASLWFGADASGDANITIGDISMTAGDSASVSVSVDQWGSGDITIGDITLVAGDSAWASVSVSGDADMTLGNISMTVGDSATAYLYLSEAGSTSNMMVVGNITQVAGDSGNAEAWIYNDGAVTIGDVSQTVGSGTDATVDLFVSTDGDANITIGNITQIGGASASLTASVTSSGSGDITIGNVAQTVGSSGNAFFYVSQTGSGDITIGNITQVGGDSASATVEVYGDGNVSVGDVSLSIGDGTGQASVSIEGSGDSVSVGNVSISAGDAKTATTAWIWADFDNWSSGDLTVGNITMSGGMNVWVGLSATHDGGIGDMTIGDIDLDVGVSGTLAFELEQYDTANSVGNMTIGDITIHLADDAVYSSSPAIIHELHGATSTTQSLGSLTVGDITVAIDADGTFEFMITQSLTGTGGGNVGDVTIGDVSVTMGIGGAFYGTDLLTVYNSASGDIGNVTVGDISIVGDDGAYISLSNFIGATNGSVGNVTFGNIDLAVGVSGTIDTVSIDINGGSIGDVSIGDISMTVGQYGSDNSGLNISISASTGNIGDISIGQIVGMFGISAYNSTDDIDVFAAGDIASFSFGGMSLDYAQGATGDGLYLTVSASGDIGDVTIGDVVVNMGVDTYISDLWYVNITADNIGNVTFGDHIVTMADGTAASYASVTSYDTVTVSASGNIGDVTFGDLTYNLGAYAYHEEGFYRYVNAGGTLGDVAFGNIDLNVATSGYFGTTNWIGVYGDDGIASVSFGDIAIDNLGAADTAGLEIDIAAATGDIGDVTFGDISLNTTGSYSAWLDVSITASDDLGLVTIGDVSLAATTNAWGAWVSIDLSYGGSAAGVELGTVSFNGVTGGLTTNLWFGLHAGTADVNIAGLTVMGTGNMGTDYIFEVNGHDVHIENISVVVSATSTGLYDLSDLLQDVNESGTLSLGTVDYSGYDLTGVTTTGESIDVSAYAGEIVVIGTSRNDTITDNDESNTLTGGDGADVFSFVNTNNYATNDVIDTITDFQHGVDKIELDTTAGFVATQYYEGTYADLATFLTAAGTQMTSVPEDNLVAGQVGSDVYVAVDLNNGDSVDMVIKLVGANISTLDFADFQFI